MTAGDGVEVSAFGQPALDEPTLYPGPTPEHSYLLLGDVVLRLAPAEGWLGEWRVEDTRLEDVLLEKGAAPPYARTAVLAYGSNASPPQLVRKFSGLADSAVPVVRASAFGLRLTFSAHINPLGYVPAAVRSADDQASPLQTWVTFLDEKQLRILDSTEPSYERVVIAPGSGRPVLELESGEQLTRCALYRTKRRVLDLQACDDLGLISQSALRELLEGHCGGPAGPLAGLFGSPETARALILLSDIPEIARLNLVVEDGLEDLVVGTSAVYGSSV